MITDPQEQALVFRPVWNFMLLILLSEHCYGFCCCIKCCNVTDEKSEVCYLYQWKCFSTLYLDICAFVEATRMSIEAEALLQEAKESIEAAQNYRSELQQRLYGLSQARKQVLM